MPSNEELERWMLAVAQGADRQAFACLFEHFAPRIKGFMLRGGCAPTLAEEIAQEALVTVWRKAALYRPGQAAVSTWVYTIARNLRIDLHRRQAGVVELDEPVLQALEHEADAAPERPEEQLWSGQLQQRVRQALAQLPAEQAQVVRLSFFEEQAHGEIARMLGLPLGTVKSRIRLAVAQLRRLLGELQ
jgi:RNA polymerase sigma-70 factor (ECF subfamily)